MNTDVHNEIITNMTLTTKGSFPSEISSEEDNLCVIIMCTCNGYVAGWTGTNLASFIPVLQLDASNMPGIASGWPGSQIWHIYQYKPLIYVNNL